MPPISKYCEWKLQNKTNTACLTNCVLIYLVFEAFWRIMQQRKQLKNNRNPENILKNFVVQACCVASHVLIGQTNACGSETKFQLGK